MKTKLLEFKEDAVSFNSKVFIELDEKDRNNLESAVKFIDRIKQVAMQSVDKNMLADLVQTEYVLTSDGVIVEIKGGSIG